MGDTGVGTTSLMQRFTQDHFQMQHFPTIGFDCGYAQIQLESRTFKVHVWSIPGQDLFRKHVVHSYLRGSAGIMMVYDITNVATIQKVPELLDEARSVYRDIPIILVGNKTDLARRIDSNSAKGFAGVYQFDHYFVCG